MMSIVAPKIYSVLLLGDAHSGKSALIESLRKYADPGYIINTGGH